MSICRCSSQQKLHSDMTAENVTQQTIMWTRSWRIPFHMHGFQEEMPFRYCRMWSHTSGQQRRWKPPSCTLKCPNTLENGCKIQLNEFSCWMPSIYCLTQMTTPTHAASFAATDYSVEACAVSSVSIMGCLLAFVYVQCLADWFLLSFCADALYTGVVKMNLLYFFEAKRTVYLHIW